MSVTNHRSLPSAWVWVAMGRETRRPSGRRVVNIAISMPSMRLYSSSSFLPRGASLRLRSLVSVMMCSRWVGGGRVRFAGTRWQDHLKVDRSPVTDCSGLHLISMAVDLFEVEADPMLRIRFVGTAC